MRNALVFAGAAMIFQNPSILRLDTSFQLSFLATAGLLYVSPVIDGWFEAVKNRLKIFLRDHRLAGEERERSNAPKKSFLREILITTLAAQFFVLPLLIYNFGRLSIVSPLANISVLPFIPLTMFLGFIAGAAGFVSVNLSAIFGWAAWLVAHGELSVIGFFARFPFSAPELGRLSIIPLLLVYLWIFWKLKKSSFNVSKI
jgi:competence protein ComEC